MTTTYHQKPQPVVRQSNGKVHHLFCNHINADGQRCFAETENGKHACPNCLERERPLPASRYTIIKSYF